MLNDHVFPLDTVILSIEVGLQSRPQYESHPSVIESVYSMALEIKALQKQIERLETPDYD